MPGTEVNEPRKPAAPESWPANNHPTSDRCAAQSPGEPLPTRSACLAAARNAHSRRGFRGTQLRSCRVGVGSRLGPSAASPASGVAGLQDRQLGRPYRRKRLAIKAAHERRLAGVARCGRSRNEELQDFVRTGSRNRGDCLQRGPRTHAQGDVAARSWCRGEVGTAAEGTHGRPRWRGENGVRLDARRFLPDGREDGMGLGGKSLSTKSGSPSPSTSASTKSRRSNGRR
jgi:hypothetical protein